MKKTLAVIIGALVTGAFLFWGAPDIPTLRAAGVPSTIPGAGTNTTTIDTTQPKITLAKWNGEVSMGVILQGMTAPGLPVGSTTEWTQGAQKMQAVPLAATAAMEDGGTEINIVLAAKPATNVFNFAISGAVNLDFYLQQPLWQEKGLGAPTALCTDTVCKTDNVGTSTRPSNVVGSYAVYYKNHRDHILGKTNYATGKAFHIYRPLVTDAVGSTTWATLSYATGTLTVTVPQNFLKAATYPVTVDPTFGYTTIGGTAVGLDSTVPGIASINTTYAAVAGDTVTAFNFYGNCTVSGSGTVTQAVYTFTTVPVTRLAAAVTQTVNSVTAQWWVNTVSQALTGGTTYAMAFGNDAAGTCTSLQAFRDTLTGTQNSQNAAGALPATWTQTGSSAVAYSLYATVTASLNNPTKVQINGTMQINGQAQIN